MRVARPPSAVAAHPRARSLLAEHLGTLLDSGDAGDGSVVPDSAWLRAPAPQVTGSAVPRPGFEDTVARAPPFMRFERNACFRASASEREIGRASCRERV